jgi:hypothetical protein
MFAAYYNNLDNIELLSASEARFQLTDIKGRSCMHYAAINDSEKVITTIFISCKTAQKPVISYKDA